MCRMPRAHTDWSDADRPRRRVGRGVESHHTIGSTNDRARELLEDAGEGRAVVAEEQTSGRGRRGRAWHSPPGLNLTVSVALRPHLDAGIAWQLAVAAGLAARAACALHAPVDLKWPNDLVTAAGDKVGGLLLETTVDGHRVTSAVVGIGLNVNWRRADMPHEIAGGATSLADLAGGPIDRVALLGALLDELDAEVVALESGRSPLERYRAACTTLGSEVAVETATGRMAGRAVEVDRNGSLVLETPAGRVALASGEVVRLRPGAPV